MTELEGQAAAPDVAVPDKLPPEALRLRAHAAPITRFQRGRIILLTTAAALFIAVVVGVALRSRHVPVASLERDEGGSAGTSTEALAALPKSYGDVPRLGPPLPGDLGQPILDRQRQLDGGASETAAGLNSATTARQARAEALDAARRSALLVAPVQPPKRVAQNASPAPSDLIESRISAASVEGENQAPNNPAHASDAVDPARQMAPASPYTLSAGSIIAASLITGINSDLPGMVVAQVTQRVFDSATGRTELIPQGSRLIGRYDHDVAFGQQRASIVWDRLILPDGRALHLDDEPATDPSGYAGLTDRVDSHSGALIKGVALSTVLGVGSDLAFDGGNNLIGALRQAAGQNVADAGNRLVSKALDVKPTLTIRPGARVLVTLHRDLVLAPWRP